MTMLMVTVVVAFPQGVNSHLHCSSMLQLLVYTRTSYNHCFLTFIYLSLTESKLSECCIIHSMGAVQQ